jgi:hypothetical protein
MCKMIEDTKINSLGAEQEGVTSQKERKAWCPLSCWKDFNLWEVQRLLGSLLMVS